VNLEWWSRHESLVFK